MKVLCPAILEVTLFLFSCAALRAQVPSEYSDLYSTMQGAIASFNSSTLAVWNGSKPPVLFAGHLANANSNSGAALLAPGNYPAFLHELDGLKALGAKAVVVNIDYPTLDPGFDAWGGQSAAFLAFYQGVASDIRGRGLKMIVETGGAFTDPVFSAVNAGPYFQSMTFSQYAAGRAAQAALIATAIQPDFLNVVEEPDTESKQTGFSEAYTLSGSVGLLTGIVNAVRATGSNVTLGAGVGSWLPNDSTGNAYTNYVQSYAGVTGLNNIDVHVYPVIRDYLARLNIIASLAKNAGKGVTVSEAWDYKQRDTELNNPFYPPAVIYSRDVYSFWAPLDAQFLQAMTNWAYYQNVDYMGAFWALYFRSYITYDSSTQNLSPSELFALSQSAAGAAIATPTTTTTGTNWYNYISASPDTAAPGAPVVTPTLYPNQIVLNWPVPADNVGVYKYTIARTGVPTVTTVDPVFTESGLASCGKYTYSVSAFDFKNNKSTTTTPVLTTLDNVAPTAPTAVTATAGAIVAGTPTTTSVRLTWSGATDNCGPAGISGYIISRSVAGGTWTPLLQVPSSPLSYTDSGIQRSATQYCYRISTVDGVSLKSPDSPVACAVTKDFLPPSVPSGVTATMGVAPNVTVGWNPSTDDVGVTGYDIQRRQGSSGAFTIIKSGHPATTYLDSTAARLPDNVPPTASVTSPAANSTISKTITFQASASDRGVTTSYTYQARALDAAGNKSVWGAGSTVSWPVAGGVMASVAFFVDGVQVYSLTAAPWYFRWDSKTVANGPHVFTVRATDSAGNVTTSAAVTATVAN